MEPDKSRLPGFDGGRTWRRAQRSAYSPIPTCTPSAVVQLVVDTCMRLYRLKALGNMSASAATLALQDQITTLTQPGACSTQKQAGRYMPRNFWSILSLLEDLHVTSPGDGYVAYDLCGGCRWPFRCEHASAEHCPRCGASRRSAGKSPVLTFTGLARRLYSVPVIAKDLSEWQQRRSSATRADSDVIADVPQGKAWAEQIDSDPSFTGEPRNLVFGLCQDPFQVRSVSKRAALGTIIARQSNAMRSFGCSSLSVLHKQCC